MSKKIPINILKWFQKEIDLSIKFHQPKEKDDFLLKFTDKDPESDFYFIVFDYTPPNEFHKTKGSYYIELLPGSEDNLAFLNLSVTTSDLYRRFKKWKQIIKEYAAIISDLEDPIVESFAKNYYNEIKLLEKDAETKPFSVDQILMLNEHLEEIETKIHKYQTDDNSAEIEEIIKDTNELKTSLTVESKNTILRKLTLIWGKISKQGVPLIKEFIKEGVKEAIKIGVKSLLELS